MSGDDKKIKVRTKDLVKFEITLGQAYQSGLIKDIVDPIEDHDEDHDYDEHPIPIPNVESKEFKKVMEYMKNHYKNRAERIERPLQGNLRDSLSDWDNEFLNKNKVGDMIVRLIKAATFLNMKYLLELMSAKLASTFKDKRIGNIKEALGIKSDFTHQEMEKIIEKNKNCIKT